MKEIKVFATFREICDGKTIQVPFEHGRLIGSILDDVISQFPAMEEEIFTPDRTVKQHVHVFINGRNIIHLEGLETAVHDEDELALFPPVAGG
ncbi:molybdopterin synthase sulfur carrier subunit [Salipaludibacillus keqinensis]|uniref:Molybdopterin synthase sulfur carrier subunit n=1 Tax=Salipaludibacillus keqinensis TaxID=2045207 RepID=A0A323THN2_9BACI|nr:ubiquitin-like small modifier protein 1 [Salipaludibacillus keqinensis]PYZ94411.1 molybdopterin synthase sulfur carrier subunit [Salipaludibacillus keqinensis]